ncbi:O-methyltransferase family protein [C1] [Richelia intracellularis]|nr:O-methyltransferase family protein [C1] [Richelia intracellularis]
MDNVPISGVTESGDDFTKFSTISQWFQTLIDPAIMQRPIS